jgi:hypothetical protein
MRLTRRGKASGCPLFRVIDDSRCPNPSKDTRTALVIYASTFSETSLVLTRSQKMTNVLNSNVADKGGMPRFVPTKGQAFQCD